MEQKPVVVLGAGFGGLRTALSLERGLRRAGLAHHYRVVLVDQNRYHTYTPLLSDVATILEDTFQERKDMAAFDVTEALRGTDIVFIQDRVTDIDAKTRMVAFLHHEPVLYSTLVGALGCVTNYFAIPGLEEHALPFKTLSDAQTLAMRLHTYAADNAQVRVVIGGAGATGIALAGSLSSLHTKLRKRFPRFSMALTVIEGQPSILPGFLPDVIRRTAPILEKRGVRFVTGRHITRAESDVVVLEDSSTIPYDIFIWTGGVKVSPLIEQLSIELDHGRAAVDGTMTCLPATPNLALEASVYAIGDLVCFHDPRTGGSVPWVARAALDQARVVSHNIVERLKAQHVPGYIPHLRTYRPRTYPFIIPLGENHAVAHIGDTTFSGSSVRFLKWFVELSYMLSLLPFWHGVRMWWRSRKIAI